MPGAPDTPPAPGVPAAWAAPRPAGRGVCSAPAGRFPAGRFLLPAPPRRPGDRCADSAAGPPTIVADPDRLAEILRNPLGRSDVDQAVLDSPRLVAPTFPGAPTRRSRAQLDDSRLRPTEEVGAAAAQDDAIARRDHLLVGRALEGDLGAFNQLVEAYQDLCHALVARMVPDPDQASDAVQEAFFSAYRNLHSYHGPSFRGWLTRIAINAAMDLQRARKRRPVSPYPELEDESWQPPAGSESDPETIATTGAPWSRRWGRSAPTSGRRSSSTTSRGTTTARSPR